MKVERKLRRERESVHTIRLGMENSNGCVPTVNGVDPDTSWLTMVTASRADIVV